MAKERKKILVTGGAGFIGSHTAVELFEAGFEPVIADNFSNSRKTVPDQIAHIIGQKVRTHVVDCNNLGHLRGVFASERNLSGVIHFAAFKSVNESVEQPLKYYENNIGSTLTLLRVMHEFGVKDLVFSSSCTVYGQPEDLPVKEDSPILPPASPYGYTKQVCEEIIQTQTLAEGSRSVLLRYFNPIGAHSSGLIGELPLGPPQNLVPRITQTAAGHFEKMTIFGDDYNTPDGTCLRDYIHVVDLAKAHVAALAWLQKEEGSGRCEVFNIGTGRGAGVRELVETFREETGVPLKVEVGPRRAGDVEAIYADTSRAEEELGWKAELSMRDALRDAWNWQQRLEAAK